VIDQTLEQLIRRAVVSKCRQLGSEVIAIGGADDHQHLLLPLPSTITIARLIGEAKGYSSWVINRCRPVDQLFRWQETYYASSVSLEELPAAESYVRNQRQHHRDDRLLAHFEIPDEP
jgi:REP element-mobilizing transposase RayT